MGSFSPMQFFFKMLKDYNYFQWHRRGEGINVLSDVLLAHPKTTDLPSLFPYVLILDATYKTNRFEMPLLEVICVSAFIKY